MENYIVIAVLALIIGAAVFYVYRAKKSGQKCIGCPYSKQCSGSCGGNCQNTGNSDKKD